MTNSMQIEAKLEEYEQMVQKYKANPTGQAWRRLNELKNSLIPFAKATPITRAEYESILTSAGCRTDNTDNGIYVQEGTWWIGDDQMAWCLAHFARQSALIAERGEYTQPTNFMLGLELVTDGLPDGFREYHRTA